MEKLKTAEAATRFLRGKDTTPEKACGVVAALTSGQIPVYLPNHTYFVFELVCDRLNDFNGKNFKNWKLSSGIWTLFAQMWQALGEKPLDREVRTKTFRGVKLVLIVSDVLATCAADYNEQLLGAMFGCVEQIMATGYVDVDEHSAVGLLKAFADLTSNVTTETAKCDVVNHWTSIVADLVALPKQAAAYKPTKKSTTRFFVEPLPVILNQLASRKVDALKPTYTALQTILTYYVFSEDTLLSLPTHVEALVSSSVLSPEGAEYLFQEVILHLASKDIGMCETVYVKIMEKYESLAEKLLGVLARVNRTLSSTFFSQMYDSEIAKPAQNWTLMGYLVSLDPDLALEKWNDVIGASTRIAFDDAVKLADDLAHGFVRARDFHRFLKEVYPAAHKVSSKLWGHDDVVKSLAAKVNELSGNQIHQLLKHFMETEDKLSLALVLHGLLLCPLTKQKASETLFQDYNFCHSGWSEIAYLVLSIYGKSLLDTQPEILQKTELSGKTTKYDIYLKFRVAELSANTELVDVEETKKFLERSDAKNLLLFAQRWIVLIDSFSDIQAVLFVRMLTQLDAEQVINYLNSQSDIIYELPGFLREFQKSLRHNPVTYRNELFCCFPPTIFRKYFGYYYNQITDDAIAHPSNAILRNTLHHILQEPSLYSNIEKDWKLLRKFLETATPDNLQISMDTAASIWNAHLSNFKDNTSSKFVHEAFEICLKNLKKPSSGDLTLAQVILGNTDTDSLPELKKLKQDLSFKFVTAVRKLSMSIEDQIIALSELPLDISDQVRSGIKSLIKEVGSGATSIEMKARLFSLVVQCALPTLSNALFVTSLFVAVSDGIEDDEQVEFMLRQLSNYFTQLDNEVYVAIYKHVLHSFENESGQFARMFVDILAVLAPLLNKTHQNEHTELFVTTIMMVSLQQNHVEHSRSLLRFVKSLTNMLSDHVWVFTQFSVEATVSFADSIVSDLAKSEHTESVYLAVVQLVSYVVLFHRYRLSSRYHLITGSASRLMKPLAGENTLGNSKAAASAYSRLLTALAEPIVQSSTKDSDSLTSQVATYKKYLRKHAHVIVVNYVHLQLTEPLESDINEAVLRGIYSVLGLLSRLELHLLNQCLDSLGKTYFKTLYAGYRDHGKWKDQ